MPESNTSDLAAFAAFEREGWKRLAPGYADGFGRCTSRAVGPLLDAAGVVAGARVLDLACGPGFAAAAAIARGAIASGLDFSAAMVERARAVSPTADVREGDAGAIPWPNGAFDSVVCNFGLNHVPDVERALGEVQRVLKPGGRLAFTVWDSAQRSPGQRILQDVIAAQGMLDPPLPPAPAADRLADPAEAKRALEGTGFIRVVTTWLEVPLAAPTPDEIFEIFRHGTLRIGALLHHQSEPDLVRIRSAFAMAVERYRGAAGIELPLRAAMTAADKS